jgi:hypothetical protein
VDIRGDASPNSGHGSIELWRNTNSRPRLEADDVYPQVGRSRTGRWGEVTSMALADFDGMA